MQKLSMLAGILTLAACLLVIWFGIVKNRVGVDSFSLLIIPYLISTILAFNACILGYLGAKAAQEDEDRILLERRKEKKALESGEDVLFSASRTLANFKKFSPYAVTALNFILISVILFLFWSHWSTRPDVPTPSNPPLWAFATGASSLFIIFAGIFFVGQSRERNFRWLRPLGGWLVLTAVLGILAAFAILMYKYDLNIWNRIIKKIIFISSAALGVELLFNFTVEFYRPRTAGEERPIFESRILSLFTEPGGLLRNISDTLDYQFGFKVSRTWIYGLMEKSIIPLIITWLAFLWVFTCISEVAPGEVGVRENFGKIVDTTPLGEGLHFKLPWPFGKMTRIPVNKIQEIIIGADMRDEKGEIKSPEVVLWTVQHYGKEDRYIVASEKKSTDKETPVSFLSANVTVQYRAQKDKIFDFAFRSCDIPVFLKSISEREISKYLASVDLLKLMSVERGKAISELSARIQASADQMKLGVEIVCVNLLDVHPPFDKVAPSFEEVASARQEKEASILNAKAYENKTLPYAAAEASKIIMDAKTSSENSIHISEAETMRFKKQLEAYRIMPAMFKLRTYLDFFERDCGEIRKIVIGDTNTNNVYIFNFEEKARMDILDADLGELSSEINKNKDNGGKQP